MEAIDILGKIPGVIQQGMCEHKNSTSTQSGKGGIDCGLLRAPA